jgi:spore coat polysaccharide biosynthesis predicted glycosyltransferase SpsG
MRCLIYTYGSHQRGMGHIYQSMALATALEADGAQVEFAVPDYAAGLDKLAVERWPLLAVPHRLTEAERIAYMAKYLPGSVDVAVLDILESSVALAQFWAQRATALVAIDEIGPGRRHADVLVNVIHHPPRPQGAEYQEIRRLDHVILRNDFCGHTPQIRSQVKRILVSQGGSDTFGGLVELVRQLDRVPAAVDIELVVGPAFGHAEALEKAMQAASRRFTVRRDVKDMAALMRQCDLAISGGGKTLFELAALGVPFIAVTEEPRELETIDIVARDVLCENIGLRCRSGDQVGTAVAGLLDDPGRRRAMSRSGQAAVDGRGAGHVAQLMAQTWERKRELAGALSL